MKITCLILVFFSLSLPQLYAQEINVSYDYSSVEKLIEILDGGELNEKDFKELVELHGTKAYLRKLSTFFPGINELSFKKSLEAVLKGVQLDKDPFMFNRILPLIPDARKLLAEVIEKEKELTQSSVSLLKEYSPENIKLNSTVYLVLGVVGGGWTFDDNPNSFYVDFASMKGDYNGLSYLSTHELFHLVQYRFMKDFPEEDADKVKYLLDQMIREGSATYVADFSKVSSSGSYIDFSKKEYERNFRRMETNFALFEAIIFQAKNDSSVNMNLLYNIGLSGMYQSPLYYVGYHMIKLIEKYNGRTELIALLSKSPEKLILTYVQLCDMHAGEDEEFIVLSETAVKILKSIPSIGGNKK
ncbi:MAG: DUF5700 domain-containing putative Zn-dependent protease [Saonia sp.]